MRVSERVFCARAERRFSTQQPRFIINNHCRNWRHRVCVCCSLARTCNKARHVRAGRHRRRRLQLAGSNAAS